MLQPLQLKEVSLRYAEEIAELRNFLAKAGLPIASAESLSRIVTRLPSDRSFHRDLMSYIWVVIDRSDRQITYPDLLGVLAIAAAGTGFAAAADEDDAHTLLRFLMESQHSLEKVSAPKDNAPIHRSVEPTSFAATKPLPSADEDRQEIFRGPLLSQRIEPPENGGRSKRIVGAVVAVVLLAALFFGFWWYRRSATDNGNTTASTATANISTSTAPATEGTTAPNVSTTTNESPAISSENNTTTTEANHATSVRKNSSGRWVRPKEQQPSRIFANGAPSIPAHPAQPTVTSSNAMGGGTHVPAATAPMASVPAPARSKVSAPASASGPHAVTIAKSKGARTPPVAVPEKTLSSRLDSPSLPSYTASNIENSKHPRLLRRHPLPPVSPDNANRVAEVRPADIPPSLANGHTNPASTAPKGDIRPTSVGIMAAYILYNPVPPYPPAASAAHVQGKVTLEANIARDGTVGSTRIISGPPLLRDAAMDAVQQWRYRPYLSNGKPIIMTDTVIMDFQLP